MFCFVFGLNIHILPVIGLFNLYLQPVPNATGADFAAAVITDPRESDSDASRVLVAAFQQVSATLT